MTTYMPAIIWLLSSVLSLGIAKRRGVKPTEAWKMLVAVLGPLAVPLVLVAQPEKSRRR